MLVVAQRVCAVIEMQIDRGIYMHVLFGCICVEYISIDVHRTLDARLLIYFSPKSQDPPGSGTHAVSAKPDAQKKLQRSDEEAQWATISQAEHVDAIRKVTDQ